VRLEELGQLKKGGHRQYPALKVFSGKREFFESLKRGVS
jgi:hypothetical protein